MSTRKRFVSDISFIAVSKYSGIFIGLIINAVLARLLSPDDYGVIGLATVFSVFFGLFSSMGIAPAVIQNQDLSQKDIADIFGFTFWLGIVLGGLFFLSSGWIADFYDNQILKSVCQWLSLSLFLGTLGMIPEALLSKKKMFKFLAVRNITFQIIGGIISIILALRGLGVYTLVISPLFTTTMNFVVNAYNVRQSFHLFPNLVSIRKILSFSAFQFLFSFVNYLGNNLGSLIIGKALSITAIGYYNKATSVVSLPVSNINGVISPVLFPYLVDLQNDIPKMFAVTHKINLLLLTVAFPIAAVLCMCADEIVLVLYGTQWLTIVPCFELLTVTAAMQIASVCSTSCLLALGRTKVLFWIGSVNTFIALLGLCIGVFLFKTIEGVALMTVLSSAWAAVFSIIVVYKPIFKQSVSPYFLYALRPLVFYLVMISCSWGFDTLVDVSWLVSILCKLLLWGGCFLLFLSFFTPYHPKCLGEICKKKI